MAVRWVDSQSVRMTGGSEMGGQSDSQDDRWQ